MTGGYDGSIRFDTSIDSKGFNTGIKRISGSMKGVMSALLKGFKVVVGIVAIIGAAIIGVVSALISAGIAIFAWAQKFTNTLYKSLSVTSAYRSKVIELKTAFDTLKGSVMGLGATLLSAIAPVIMTVINWLVKAINYVSMFIAALRGQKTVMQYVSGSAEGAANSAGKLAKNTKEAGKAAKGALAAFDQLNVLQMQEPEEGSGGGGGNVVMREVEIDPGISETAEKIKKFFSDAWDWVKEKATGVWTWIVGIWSTFSEWFRTNVWTPISTWFMDNVFTPLQTKFEELKAYFIDFWMSVMQPAIDWIVNNVWPIFEWIGKMLGTMFMITLPATLQFLWGVIKSVFTWIVDVVKNVWTTAVGVVKGIMTVLEGLIQFLTGAFTGNWTKAWDGIKRIFSGVWETIVAMSKGFVNLLIDTVNALIRAVTAGINAVIGSLNKISVNIPDWIPTYGGKKFGLSIPSVSAPQIPKLATGAVIPPNSQFLAVLGDQKHGTNIEAPADLIRQIVREETQNMTNGVTVNFTGTMAALIQAMNPEIKRENKRVGASLIVGA